MLTLTVLMLTMTGDVGARSARLLDEPALRLAQVDAPPLVPVEPSDAQVSAAQLQVDLDALKRQRPGIGGPISLVAIGGSLAILGGVYTLVGASTSGFGVSAVASMIYVGIGLLAVGVPMAVLGVWLLVTRLGDRAAIDAEMKRLRQQLDVARERERVAPTWTPPVSMVVPALELARF